MLRPNEVAVETGVDVALPMYGVSGPMDATDERWDAAINQLIEWATIPTGDDPELELPGRDVLEKASRITLDLKCRGLPPPDTLVVDANGGVVFERRDGNLVEVIHVWDDGDVDYQRFKGTKMIDRRLL